MSAPRPIDFSIPQGRIGAPIRKGHPIEPKPAQPERVVIDKDIHVLLTIRCEGAPPVDVAFAVSASLGSLHQEVATVVGGNCFLRVFSHGALLWESAPQSDGAAARDDAQRSLQSVGVQAGGKLLAVCTPAEAVHRVHAADAQRDAFDGRRTFEQEDELEWRRRNARPMRAQRASGSLADYSWGFAHIEALPRDPNTGRDYTTPPPAECQALLEALAADPGIQAVMQEHGWRVGRLTEIAPGLDTGVVGLSDVCLLGLNINKGQEIQLRLRTSDLLGVRPYWLIKKTLLHELTHCVHSEHDAKFWALCSQLMRDADAGDWTKSRGRALAEGGARAAAPNAPPEQGRRLGGSPPEVPTAPRRSAAWRARRRGRSASTRCDRHCGKRAVRQDGKGGGSSGGLGAALRAAEARREGGSDGGREGDATAAGGGAAPAEGGGGHAAVGEQCGCGGHLKSPAAAAAGVDALAPPRGAAEEPRGAAAEAGVSAGRALPEAGLIAPQVLSDGGMDAQRPVAPSASPSAAPPAREAAAGAAAEEAAGGGGGLTEAAGAEAALVGLGFSPRSTRAALARFHGSAARAADWLLAGGGADAAAAADAADAADAGVADAGAAGAVAAPGEAALRARVEAALQRLVGGLAPDFAAARVALETVRSMLARIAAAPREARFRRVRLDNGAFRARVGRHAGGKELLLAANFRRSGDGSALECAAGPAELAVAASLFDAALDALP